MQHQPGQLVGNDAAPEFHVKTLPPGSAPASKTFQPNPIDETPGQADNELAGRMHGKESTQTGALDMPGATSADVHQGYGHPGQGQTSQELRHEGAHGRKKDPPGLDGRDLGGSGLVGEESTEARRLQKDHEGGPIVEREHNVSLEGAEDKLPTSAEQLASEASKVKQGDYDRQAEKPPGKHS